MADDVALLNVKFENGALVICELVKRIEADLRKPLLSPLDILKVVSDLNRDVASQLLRVQIDGLLACLKSGKNVLMRVAEQAIGEFLRLFRDGDLIAHEFGFARKMQAQVRRPTIRTKEGNGKNTVVSTAMVAHQLPHKVVAHENRLRLWRR